MRSPVLDVVEKLQSARGLDEFWSIGTAAFEACGVTSILYAAARLSRRASIAPAHALPLSAHEPPARIRRSIRRTDAPRRRLYRRVVPQFREILRWHVFDDNDRSTPEQRRRAGPGEREMGLYVGVTVPTALLTAGHNGGLGLSMAQVRAGEFQSYWQRYGSDILAIGAVFDTCMRQTHIAEMVSLSNRERQCLEFLAAGYKLCHSGT